MNRNILYIRTSFANNFRWRLPCLNTRDKYSVKRIVRVERFVIVAYLRPWFEHREAREKNFAYSLVYIASSERENDETSASAFLWRVRVNVNMASSSFQIEHVSWLAVSWKLPILIIVRSFPTNDDYVMRTIVLRSARSKTYDVNSTRSVFAPFISSDVDKFFPRN